MYIDQIKSIKKELYNKVWIDHNTSLNNFKKVSCINSRPNIKDGLYQNDDYSFNIDNNYSLDVTKYGLISNLNVLYMKNMEVNAEKFFIDIRDKTKDISSILIMNRVKKIEPKNVLMDRNTNGFISRFGYMNSSSYQHLVIFNDDINTIVEDFYSNYVQMVIYMFDKIELNTKGINFRETQEDYIAETYQDFKVINPKILYIINDSESDNYKLYKQFLRDEKLNKLCI